MDRRSQRSRESLHHALIKLMIKKSYETITIQDIIDHANVGRATFYSHYRSKDDLLQGGFKHLHLLLQAAQRAAWNKSKHSSQLFSFTLTLFEHVHDHGELYKAIVGKRSEMVVINAFNAVLTDLVRAELRKRQLRVVGVSITMLIAFVVGGLMSILTTWLEQPSSTTPAEVNAVFKRLCSQTFGLS